MIIMIESIAYEIKSVTGKAWTNIDNEGTVVLTAKGRDTRCALTDCLIGAINHVAVALDCRA